MKETGYHSEEWEETDPESEWPVVIPAVIEKIREPLNPDDDPDEIDPNDLELWLEKDLTVKEAVKNKTTSIYIYDKWWRSPGVCITLFITFTNFLIYSHTRKQDLSKKTEILII